MLKTGAWKRSLDRVPASARALEADPAHLMRPALTRVVGKTTSVVVLETVGAPTTVNQRACQDLTDAVRNPRLRCGE